MNRSRQHRHRRWAPALAACASLGLGACGTAPIEVPLFPDRLAMLGQAEARIEGSGAELQVAEPFERVLAAARIVLHQHAVLVRVGAASDEGIDLFYVDRTSFAVADKRTPVELPFRLRLRATGPATTLARVDGLWPQITDDRYRKDAPARLDALRSTMAAEAWLVLDRIGRQSGAAWPGASRRGAS